MGLNLKYFSWLYLEDKKHDFNYLTDLKCFHMCKENTLCVFTYSLQSRFYWHKWEPGYTFVFSCRITTAFRDSAVSLVNRRDLFGSGYLSIFQYLFHPLHALRASTAYTLLFLFSSGLLQESSRDLGRKERR